MPILDDEWVIQPAVFYDKIIDTQLVSKAKEGKMTEKIGLLNKIYELHDKISILQHEKREAEKGLLLPDIIRITNRVLRIHGKPPLKMSKTSASKTETAQRLSNLLYSLISDHSREVD